MMGGFISEDPLTFGGRQQSFYAYVNGNPVQYVDRNGQDPVMAGVGLLVGGIWGYVNGVISGDQGQDLLNDTLAGAAAGGLAGLTDGVSLLEGAGGILARAGIAGGMEAGRQAANSYEDKGCVELNYAEIAIAGVGSVAGDALGDGVQNAAGDFGASSDAAKGIGAGVGDAFGGSFGVPPAMVDGANGAANQ